jgi:CRP-like cAMP-binding protein
MRFRRTDDVFVEALTDAGLERSVARQLATAGTPIHVSAGTELCREGDYGREAFVLVSGAAVVRLDTADRRVQPGEVFGEIAVLDPTRQRTATVEATEPSLVLVYDVATFRYLAQQHADVLAPPRAA